MTTSQPPRHRPRRRNLRQPWALALLLAAATATAETPTPTLSYGGPFELVDHSGASVTDGDYRGEFMLVFFGYTHCPDVCPTTLVTVGSALRRIGEAAERVRPLFVSVDPKRDSPERLKTYAQAFHPRMVGLTGSREQIFAAARAYRAFYFAGEVDGRYVVDHTANLYLMGPDGEFLAIFPHDVSASDLSAALTDRIVAAGR